MTKTTEQDVTKTPACFDFASRDSAARCEEGVEMDVLDPSTNESTGAFITLAGTDSDPHRRASAMIAKRRAKGGFRAKTFDPDKFLAENIELLAACTLSWRGVVLSGETLPCTKSSAITLYTRFPWLREQVEAFISERTN
ncbi:MAG: hypothetical protein RR317_06440, partial [Bilophila sp.]